jgi:hypothetical protein
MILSNSQRVENYVNQFIQNGCPYFLLTNDKIKSIVIIDRNDGVKAEEDITEAAEKLRQTLTREFLNNDRSKLILHCYECLPAKGKRLGINSTADYTIFCTFYPELMENGYTPRQNMYGIPQRDEALNSKVERLTDAVAALTTKIELQDAESDDDIEEQAQPNIGNALLGMVSNSPQLQQLLINMFANFATNGMASKPTGQTVGLAGIEDTDVETALQALFDKGVTVSDLIKLAAMDKVQIDFLLGMLRK